MEEASDLVVHYINSRTFSFLSLERVEKSVLIIGFEALFDLQILDTHCTVFGEHSHHRADTNDGATIFGRIRMALSFWSV